jgi:hypothetical protein
MASQICYFFTVLVDVSASRLALVPLDSVVLILLDSVVLILLLFRLVQCNLKFQIQNTSLVLSNSNSTAVIHVVSLEILKCEPSRPLNCKPLLFECSSFCHDYFFLFMFFNVILNLRHLLCLFHCSSQKKGSFVKTAWIDLGLQTQKPQSVAFFTRYVFCWHTCSHSPEIINSIVIMWNK